MEKDDEIKGDRGTSYDFGARMYDTRVGRWSAVDPLAGKYPYASPYSFVLNSPIQSIDPDGRLVIFINGLTDDSNPDGPERGKPLYWSPDLLKVVQNSHIVIYNKKSTNHQWAYFVDGNRTAMYNNLNHKWFTRNATHGDLAAYKRYDAGIEDAHKQYFEIIKSSEGAQ